MLIGEYSHNIDEKGRFNFPSKFREDMGERFIVTKGFDSNSCLFVYSKEEWSVLADKISALPFSKTRNILLLHRMNRTEITQGSTFPTCVMVQRQCLSILILMSMNQLS